VLAWIEDNLSISHEAQVALELVQAVLIIFTTTIYQIVLICVFFLPLRVLLLDVLGLE
jgi:hypothetical protein